MKIKRIDRRVEKNILIGMIVSDNFLAKVSSKYKPSFLRNSYAKTIAHWCCTYYEKYEEAPKSKIEDLYHYHSKKNTVKENDVDMIEKLLVTISEEYSEKDNLNISFLLDKTEEYFNKIVIENTIEKVNSELEIGDIKKATSTMLLGEEIKLTSSNAIDPFADEQRVKEAFSEVSTPLFQLKKDAGRFLNEHLTRDSFIAIQAPEKSGKTWMLYHLALEALKKRLKVVIFAIGDMTENQTIVRLSIAISKKNNKMKYCGHLKCPVKFVESEDEVKEVQILPKNHDIEYKNISIETPLDFHQAKKNIDKFYTRYRIKPNLHFRLVTSPADTMNIKDIDIKLQELQKQENFVADVVVIDYMDILEAENSFDIGRDRINNNWKQAKSLCNKHHILLLSATQADGNSYSGMLQSKANFSEDKRKYSHVNGMIGLNQTDEEKKSNIIKLNWIVLREGEFNTSLPCYIIQDLRRGQAIVDSLIVKKQNRHIETSNQEQESEQKEIKNPSKRRNLRRR